jgi:hypothetical protein
MQVEFDYEGRDEKFIKMAQLKTKNCLKVINIIPSLKLLLFYQINKWQFKQNFQAMSNIEMRTLNS